MTGKHTVRTSYLLLPIYSLRFTVHITVYGLPFVYRHSIPVKRRTSVDDQLFCFQFGISHWKMFLYGYRLTAKEESSSTTAILHGCYTIPSHSQNFIFRGNESSFQAPSQVILSSETVLHRWPRDGESLTLGSAFWSQWFTMHMYFSLPHCLIDESPLSELLCWEAMLLCWEAMLGAVIKATPLCCPNP
jgi:hypothetical protein